MIAKAFEDNAKMCVAQAPRESKEDFYDSEKTLTLHLRSELEILCKQCSELFFALEEKENIIFNRKMEHYKTEEPTSVVSDLFDKIFFAQDMILKATTFIKKI